jgi:Glycosyltransferase family 87
MTGKRSLWLYSILALPITLAMIYRFFLPGPGIFVQSGHVIGRDFANFWVGAKLHAEGLATRAYDVFAYQPEVDRLLTHVGRAYAWAPGDFPQIYMWSYPPTAALLMEPLAWFSYVSAYVLFLILTFALYSAVVLKAAPVGTRAVALVALLAASSTHFVVLIGHNGFVTATLLLGAVLLADKRPIVAGMLLGILTVKPHLGLFIAPILLIERRWTMIAAASATASALIGLSLACYGAEPWVAFFTKTGPLVNEAMRDFGGFQTYVMVSVLTSARVMGIGYEAAMALQVAIATLVIVLGCRLVPRLRTMEERVLVIALGTFLTTPYAFNYDMPVLTAALVLTVLHGTPMPERVVPYLGLIWILPIAMMPLQMVGIGLAIVPIAVVFLGMCQAYGLLARLDPRRPAQA